jgi:hypothetical protein
MNQDILNVQEILKKYKKTIIVAVLALVSVLVLSVVGIGFAAYKFGLFATDKVKGWQEQATTHVEQASLPTMGFAEGVVLNVASQWLKGSLAGAEVAQMREGLACFDALGGPSPEAIVGFVKANAPDPQMAAALDKLGESLKATSGAQSNGTVACANWLLNG